MATSDKFIARDVYVEIDGVDVSSYVQKIDAPEKWDNVDVTGMGAKFKERLLGIGDFSVALTLFQSYAAGAVFQTLKSIAGFNTPVSVTLRPSKTDAVSATNPNLTFQAVVDSNDLVNGSVGAASMVDVTLWNADQAGVTVTYT